MWETSPGTQRGGQPATFDSGRSSPQPHASPSHPSLQMGGCTCDTVRGRGSSELRVYSSQDTRGKPTEIAMLLLVWQRQRWTVGDRSELGDEMQRGERWGVASKVAEASKRACPEAGSTYSHRSWSVARMPRVWSDMEQQPRHVSATYTYQLLSHLCCRRFCILGCYQGTREGSTNNKYKRSVSQSHYHFHTSTVAGSTWPHGDLARTELVN